MFMVSSFQISKIFQKLAIGKGMKEVFAVILNYSITLIEMRISISIIEY